MDIANLVLEYIKALLSVQMVLGALAAIALVLFKTELRALLNRVASFKWGSAEISAPQPTSTAPTETGAEPGKLPGPELPVLPAGIQVNAEDAKRLEQAMLSERARAHYWEYRYLNHFLVANTQRALDWLASLPNAATFTTYDALWQLRVPTAEERRKIIRALEEHNLVVLHGDLIEVTQKGREYLEWRGPIPAVPVPPPTSRYATRPRS